MSRWSDHVGSQTANPTTGSHPTGISRFSRPQIAKGFLMLKA